LASFCLACAGWLRSEALCFGSPLACCGFEIAKIVTIKPYRAYGGDCLAIVTREIDPPRLDQEHAACRSQRDVAAGAFEQRHVEDAFEQLDLPAEHLAANILSGIVNPTRAKLLSDREAEQAALEAKLAQQATTVPPGAVLPHPTLLRLFEKVGELRQALDAERVRGEAAEILAKLIDSVTVYPNGEHGPEAEVATPMQVALAWLLRRSPNILLIPGTSSVEHLRENMASGSLELGEDAMRRLDGIGVA
jgi:hypothetical protein